MPTCVHGFTGLCIAFALLFGPRTVRSQNLPAGGELADYARVMQLAGSGDRNGFTVQPRPLPEDWHGPWATRVNAYVRSVGLFDLRLASPSATAGFAATRPAGTNDGFLWQGRGVSARAELGIYARAAVLEGAFRPEIGLVQNSDFDTGPGDWRHYLARPTIDAPRRFGTEPIVAVHPGQSYVQLRSLGLAAGFSTQNMWWGPALRNPILMSSNAPGFAHVYVGTSRPARLGPIDLQARLLWGNLYESEYYDENPANDRRYITAAAIEMQPAFIPGLYLGAARVFVQAKNPAESRDYLIIFQNFFKRFLEEQHDRWGFDDNDQMVSAFARWVFPKSGFEVYGELAVGDHSADLRDRIVQLKHATGYTFGLQKVAEVGEDLLRAQVEITRLEAPKSDVLRTGGDVPDYEATTTSFYVNTVVRQGYTHRGQVIGAGIGPGSNSQFAGADLFARWGRIGGYVQRVVYDNDLFFAYSGDTDAHQVEFISGVRGLLFHGPVELTADLALRLYLNQYYEVGNDAWNPTAQLGIRWNIGRYP